MLLHRLLSNDTAIEDDVLQRIEEQEEDDVFVVLYRSMVFLLSLWICGDFICGEIIRLVPPLVGQIAVGIALGPYGLDLLESQSDCWPNLGELGLVLMLCQAGMEMDFEVLQVVGPRGALMALVGSILPSTIGFLIAYLALGLSTEAALAVGCSFGPTSAGIALNVLNQCNVLKTPLGQLIVAIAIVDDIIALVVLSQLKALTGDSITVASVAVPIASALLWLFLGGVIALYAMPRLLQGLTSVEVSLFSKLSPNNGSSESRTISGTTPDSFYLAHIVVLLFVLLPATYYSQASHLLGAFLAGLSVCQQTESAPIYNRELGKIIEWLLRIFFGATIAFRIPIELFGDPSVIANGFLLSLALLGKIMTGLLLTPVHFKVSSENNKEGTDMTNNDHDNNDATTKNRRCYDQHHLRDCLVVGFSMAGEAEFAMLVATFGFNEGLFEESIYASAVFAILLSTILSPCSLRLTLAIFPPPYDNEDGSDNDGEEVQDGGTSCERNTSHDDGEIQHEQQEVLAIPPQP